MAVTPIILRSQPGIQRDGTSFDGDAYSDGQHVRFDRGRPRKMWGARVLCNTMLEVSRGLGSFTRAGNVYIHSGGEEYCISAVFDYSGFGASVSDRTPAIYVPDADNSWTFDTISDPIVNNNAMVVAHAAPNLTLIDNNVELPVYWGAVDAGTALQPLGLPVLNDATTIDTMTGDTTAGSAVIANFADTTGLAYGYTVSGTGIPTGSYITEVTSSTSITISENATATNAGTSLTFTTGGVSGGVVALHPYLLAYSSNGYIQWSTPLAAGNTPADFWSAGSGEAFVTSQKIVRGMALRGGPGTSPAGLFWSLNSLVRATFAGGSTVFNFDTISDTISILSPKSVVEVDGVYYWAGVDRFYMFGGTVRELPNNRNLSWFFDGMNRNYQQKCFAFTVARWGEIWFCYPRGDETECSHAVIYNWRLNEWYDTQLLNSGRSAAISANVFPYPIMAGVDEDDTTNYYYLWQHECGLDEMRGPRTLPIKSWFTTANFALTTLGQQPKDAAMRVVRVEPDFVQSGDMTVCVEGEANPKAKTISTDPATIYEQPSTPQQQVVELKSTRRIMRFKFESNTLGGDYYAGKTLGFVEESDKRYTGAVNS